MAINSRQQRRRRRHWQRICHYRFADRQNPLEKLPECEVFTQYSKCKYFWHRFINVHVIVIPPPIPILHLKYRKCIQSKLLFSNLFNFLDYHHADFSSNYIIHIWIDSFTRLYKLINYFVNITLL